ncbi:MAG TPA: hypothetical protein VGZ47_18070, partial [Gemmataceae bacterium]|nr:hypothetical protein [Gemmataceae bacterium]
MVKKIRILLPVLVVSIVVILGAIAIGRLARHPQTKPRVTLAYDVLGFPADHPYSVHPLLKAIIVCDGMEV